MNYFDYINSIQPSADVKSKIKASAKAEFIKEKRRKLHHRKTFISIAACFVIFIAAFTAISQIGTSKFKDASIDDASTAMEYYVLDAARQCKCIHRITVNGKEYGSTFGYGESKLPKDLNGNTVIRKSDLVKKICVLDKMTICNYPKFNVDYYNVDIYEYRTIEDKEYIIAKTENDYFLFSRYIGED